MAETKRRGPLTPAKPTLKAQPSNPKLLERGLNSRRSPRILDDLGTIKALEEGRVTLEPFLKRKKVWVRNAGSLNYQLHQPRGQTVEDTLRNPMFVDPDGRQWRGRFYQESCTIHFQMVLKKNEKKL